VEIISAYTRSEALADGTLDYDNKLARDLYAAHLEIVEGFSPDAAERISLRQCPENYYGLAEDLRAEFPAYRGDQSNVE
jgi:hypothetical protein